MLSEHQNSDVVFLEKYYVENVRGNICSFFISYSIIFTYIYFEYI